MSGFPPRRGGARSPRAPGTCRRRARADLHCHTTASDGTWTPEEAVRRAAAAGLAALGISDHDTLDGIAPAMAAGARLGVEVVPGVEINTRHGGTDVHILGYYVDSGDAGLNRVLAEKRDARRLRLDRMLTRLEAAGIRVPAECVLALAGGGPVGRPHLARALVEAGYASSVAEAFDRYLVPGAPGYVPRDPMTPAEAVRAILAAGGVPVLAHPGLTARDDLIPGLVAAGLAGIEAHHPAHDLKQRRRYAAVAGRLGLIVTGGSDAHGPGGPAHSAEGEDVGTVTVRYEVVRALRRRARDGAGAAGEGARRASW